MGSFLRAALIAALLPALSGCETPVDTPLVVATTWSATERSHFELDRDPITWIELTVDERLESVVDRRGGVDLWLGGSVPDYERLDRAGLLDGTNPASRDGTKPTWRVVRRAAIVKSSDRTADPRVDPAALALAKWTLLSEGWSKGYEALVRDAAGARPVEGSIPVGPAEGIALTRVGRNPARAAEFLRGLEARGLAGPLSPQTLADASADELLADLLGAALVDARDDLREADAALARFGHPARAEAALAERPPWPPASAAKLGAGPNGGPMVETLLEQVAPDPEARAWLAASWSRPKRSVDGELLAEVAAAAGGRLAHEPRFRAWLRGEWTAWTRQLYRRVARLAGGYNPS